MQILLPEPHPYVTDPSRVLGNNNPNLNLARIYVPWIKPGFMWAANQVKNLSEIQRTKTKIIEFLRKLLSMKHGNWTWIQ